MKFDIGAISLVTFCCLGFPRLFTQGAPQQVANGLKPGVVVEKVAKNSESAKAGIKEDRQQQSFRLP